MLKIYNSLPRKKQEFKPIIPGKINLYACGNTVYDYCHIGHARSMIMFDVIIRYLRYQGYEVTYVRNITDIDDKIIKRALENKESISELTRRFIEAQREDELALGLLKPTFEPRATEFIEPMIDLIKELCEQGFAYVAENGDVYFDVRKFKDYGKLSKRKIEELRSGVRIELNDIKRDPLDFVLWKISKPDEPKWPSPWGEGRPGWHIECSAMSTRLLGQPFDIHGGGMDLKFPHHENEIAQSEAANGKEFAKVWMHVGLLQINKEKMSKSLGNFLTIRDALAKHHPEVLRYFMISGNYRSPVNYSAENLSQAAHAVHHFYLTLRDLPNVEIIKNGDAYQQKFQTAMDDDFNTPLALAVLFDLSKEINRQRNLDIQQAAELGAVLKQLGNVLGILQSSPEDFLRGSLQTDEATQIEKLILARNQARAAKDWQEADRIRQQLLSMGVVLEDASTGTNWRRL